MPLEFLKASYASIIIGYSARNFQIESVFKFIVGVSLILTLRFLASFHDLTCVSIVPQYTSQKQ